MEIKLFVFICLICKKIIDIEDEYFNNYCPGCYYSLRNYEEDIIQK